MKWLLVILILIPICNAQKIGVTPTEIDLTVFDEGLSELIIINPNKIEMVYSIEVEDYLDWFSFVPTAGTIEAYGNEKVKIHVQPKGEFPKGTYTTKIRINPNPNGEGVTLSPGITIPTTIRLTRFQKIKGRVYDVDVIRSNSLTFKIDFQNTGNAITIPYALIDVLEGDRNRTFRKNLLTYRPKERKISEIFLDVEGIRGKIKVYTDQLVFEEEYRAYDPFKGRRIVKKGVERSYLIHFIGLLIILMIFTAILIHYRNLRGF